LMGGIGYFGIHPHEDANAISRYQRFGENWLMDDVYQGAGAAADHCSISVLRNAERQRLPYLVRKQAAVETPSFAYVKSSLDEYGGTDWTRHVLWLKGMGFIVIDDLPVRIPGPYAIECLWRMESPAELTGNVAHSPREEAHFYLANADRSQKKLKPGAKSKPTLRQMRIGEFKLGDRVTFLNTFWAQDGQAAPKYSWSPLGERLAILKEAGLRTVAGIAEDDGGSTSIGDIRIEADTFVISPEKIFLWNARRISCGQEIFRSDLPVTAELDLKTGSGSLRTSAYARVKILAEDGPETLLVQQGKTDVTWKPSQRLVSTLATALAKLETGDRTAGTSARNIPRAETLWQFRSESQKKALGVVTGDLDGDGLSDLIAVERIDKKNHQLTAISSRGEKQWSFAFEYPPGALHLADADGDGKGEVYLGEHLGAFRKISHEGKVLWSNWRPKPPKGGDRPFVSIVKHADIDG
ncbi:MAG: VCBS repeat-containing protein, partial [Planctomycetota bacterium]|nr:VCBS repeat-containing protein [Planctomycetota bacterium]